MNTQALEASVATLEAYVDTLTTGQALAELRTIADTWAMAHIVGNRAADACLAPVLVLLVARIHDLSDVDIAEPSPEFRVLVRQVLTEQAGLAASVHDPLRVVEPT